MKKFLITAAFALVIASAGFASDVVKVNDKIQSAFRKEFVSAFNPSWESLGSGIFHVCFLLSGQVMDAYFNEEGELVSIGRYVSIDQLPILVNKTIQDRFPGSELKQIHELVIENETSYLVTIEKGQKTIIARVFTNGESQVIRKIKNVKPTH